MLKTCEDFSMLAQRIKKVFLSSPKYSEDKSISNLLVNGDPIRQSVIWPRKRRKHLFSFLQHVVLRLKDCLT